MLFLLLLFSFLCISLYFLYFLCSFDIDADINNTVFFQIINPNLISRICLHFGKSSHSPVNCVKNLFSEEL